MADALSLFVSTIMYIRPKETEGVFPVNHTSSDLGVVSVVGRSEEIQTAQITYTNQ